MRDYDKAKKIVPVVLESPYAGEIERNKAFARACMKNCILRGEAPFASHLLYPGVLDDDEADERELGLTAGWAWLLRAEYSVVYTDLGISPGMHRGIAIAKAHGLPVRYRRLGWPK